MALSNTNEISGEKACFSFICCRLMKKFDRDKNGVLDRAEAPPMLSALACCDRPWLVTGLPGTAGLQE